MQANELRQLFLEFFRQRGHTIVPSSPLVPGNDPTLLFTNAGMVQFKEVFLGNEQRSYSRAASAQRCVRAGGKHNDLDHVGYTDRHHTFFEMLGNFSFGDYFKQTAIRYCWELMTEVMQLSPSRLWVTTYQQDSEAERIWLEEIGIDPDRFTRCGDNSNFWSMGDVGPCGPCSEVFYDHGPEIKGGPPGSPDEDGDRYIEIWNLVFMQYNRDADARLHPLPRPSVDTGMGLERIAAVLQGMHSNYQTDLFTGLIQAAAEWTATDNVTDKSLRVIADHIRSCAFLIMDGVVPTNEGRGYVLRRIIRRAIRHGHRLGMRTPFFWRMVDALNTQMGDAYPALGAQRERIERVLRQEEEQFAKTLDQGMRLLDDAIHTLNDDTLAGNTVFKLYDTYGFPADLTADIAREHRLKVDWSGFDQCMHDQRARARASSTMLRRVVNDKPITTPDHGAGGLPETTFTGYEQLTGKALILGLYRNNDSVGTLKPKDNGWVVLDTTPFYPEGGGQIGDCGHLEQGSTRFTVEDTQPLGDSIAHIGVVTSGTLRVGDCIHAWVDPTMRLASARNHSATHLLHAALQEVLGDHVQQQGSLVAPSRLRFDFSHDQAVSNDELARIERRVNEWILRNERIVTQIMPLEQAKSSGAVALFGEKYTDPVRVLKIGDQSTELCGGTHVRRSGDIGLFKLTAEMGIAAGVRRLQAVTGDQALASVNETTQRLQRIAALVKSDPTQVVDRVEAIIVRHRELEKELEKMQARLAASQGNDLLPMAVAINGVQVLCARIDNTDAKQLRNTVDQLKNKLGSAVIVLATAAAGKVSLIVGVTKDVIDRVSANTLVNFVAGQVGGKGGGRADLAQAGGNNPAHLDQAIASAFEWAQERLQAANRGSNPRDDG